MMSWKCTNTGLLASLSPAANPAKVEAAQASRAEPVAAAIVQPEGSSRRPSSLELEPGTRVTLLLSASVAYAVLARLSGLSGPDNTPIAELWLPAGLSAALALRVGFWAVPLPLLGTLLSQLSAGEALGPTAVVVGMAHACATALLAALAPCWMRGHDLLASLRNLLAFLAAAAVAALLSTLMAGLVVPELRDWSLQGDALGWWGGDITGVIVLAPALLSWMGRPAAPRLRELRRPEFLLLVVGCVLATVIADLGLIKVLTLRPLTLLVPLTLWGALRFSPAAATTANVVLALGLSLPPDQDEQLLQSFSGLESQELLELTLATTLFVGLVVLVVSNTRARASRQLAQLAGSLERTVSERTEELAEANARLLQLSQTDGLTGLANRRHFDARLREQWQQLAAAGGGELAVALIDIDHFKLYNDHYGHQAGDRCLQQVAQLLGEQVRHERDCAARYGGEEFALLWADLNSSQAAALAERLQQHLAAQQLEHAASPVAAVVSLSIGVASARLSRQDATAPSDERQHRIEQLLQLADQRLYAAKDGGRNRVVAR
jgi:diguanylate cyclase (GGDEF)-like protein